MEVVRHVTNALEDSWDCLKPKTNMIEISSI